MSEHGARPLGDVIIHEQDLRGALEAPGAQGTTGLRSVRDRVLARFAGELGDRPPIALVSATWQWASRGSADNAAALVRATEFDLARALMSRRPAGQLRAWTSHGHIDGYLDAFETLGPLPDADLSEY
jgi:hypothetical protein